MTIESAWPDTAPQCSLPGAKIYWGPDTPDWCTPLEDPTWVEAPQSTLMRDDDTVLGFEAVGQIWSIPWWVMKNHHVANLTLEGKPFLVTLCEYCVAGGVFDPVIDGRRLRFRVSGWYRSSPLMADNVTGSLWALVNGQPLQGPAVAFGRLPKRPIVHTTWSRWRSMYPETWIVHGEGEPRDGHGSDFPGPDHQKLEGKLHDTRLGALDLVVAVELGDSRCAYPLSDVHAAGGIVDDEVDSRSIAVVALPGSWLVVAFEREFAGALVQLGWDESEEPRRHLVDARTGSRFDLWGVCVDGEHRGAALRYVPSALKKWIVWTVTNPGSRLWRPDTPAQS